MMMDGVVLAELEGLEAINDNIGDRGAVAHHPVMEKQTVPSKACNVSIDGLGRDFKVASYLAIGHPSCGLHEYLRVQPGQLLPVGSRESLCTEAAVAGFAGSICPCKKEVKK